MAFMAVCRRACRQELPQWPHAHSVRVRVESSYIGGQSHCLHVPSSITPPDRGTNDPNTSWALELAFMTVCRRACRQELPQWPRAQSVRVRAESSYIGGQSQCLDRSLPLQCHSRVF